MHMCFAIMLGGVTIAKSKNKLIVFVSLPPDSGLGGCAVRGLLVCWCVGVLVLLVGVVNCEHFVCFEC